MARISQMNTGNEMRRTEVAQEEDAAYVRMYIGMCVQ